MRGHKYLVAVALLAVLAVAFGLAGTVAPRSELVSPQSSSSSSSSDSVTHFVNPPTYDSNWTDITDKRGQFFNVTHDLNTTEALVDVVGRQSLMGGDHKLFLDTTINIEGFNQTYGGASSDYCRSVVQTIDGGYAVAGHTESFGAGDNDDVWLVKTDSAGNVQWNKTYGGIATDGAWSVVQTSDGGYALAGCTDSFGAGNYDFWLVKTNSSGHMQWNKTYGEANSEQALSMVQTGDGGYAIAGQAWSSGPSGFDFWLVKTNSSGHMQWNKTYGGTEYDFAYSVVQTGDEGYAVAGYTKSFGAGEYDFWLVKTDSAGNVQWNKTYGGIATDVAYSVVQTGDGGYAVAGGAASFGAGNFDFWLVKTNSSGHMQWNKTYGGVSPDVAYSMVQTSDEGYAMAGYTGSFGPGFYAFWLVKTDSSGHMQWNKTYGGANNDYAHSVVQTIDGGYAMAGDTKSFDAGEYDFWLVKTGMGELGFSLGLSMTDFTNSTITFYRGSADFFWNYLRVRIWLMKEPTWMFGDINQDGVVDAQDLYIVSRNYGKTFSALSVTGIIAVTGLYAYKKRKKQPA